MHDALRRDREAVLVGAVVEAGQDLLAQFGIPSSSGSLPSSRSAKASTLAPISPITSISGW
jgi:hypothetical protein